jgi:hypothetical protein
LKKKPKAKTAEQTLKATKKSPNHFSGAYCPVALKSKPAY